MVTLNQEAKNKIKEIVETEVNRALKDAEAKIAEIAKKLSDKNAELQETLDNTKLSNAELLDMLKQRLGDNEIDLYKIMEVVYYVFGIDEILEVLGVDDLLNHIWVNYDCTFAHFAKENLDYDTRREITIDFVKNNI